MASPLLKKHIEDDVLGAKLTLTAYHYTRYVEKALEHYALSYHTYLVLYFTDKIPRVSVKELAVVMEVSQPIISRTLMQLEARRLIKKHAAADKRQVEVQLTTTGKKLLKQSLAKIHEVSFMMRHQPEFRIETAMNHLDKINAAIETAKERPLIYNKTMSDSSDEPVIVKIAGHIKGLAFN